MLESTYIGCHMKGKLPDGLNVRQGDFDSHQKLISDPEYNFPEEWIEAINKKEVKFRSILKWLVVLPWRSMTHNRKPSGKFPKSKTVFVGGRRNWQLILKRCHHFCSYGRLPGRNRRLVMNGGRCLNWNNERNSGPGDDGLWNCYGAPSCIERNPMGAIKVINAAELVVNTKYH